MKLRFVIGAVSFVICLLLSSGVRAGNERLDIDPVVQGLWKVHATSEDEGVTIKHVDPAQTLCRVRATKVTFSNGHELRVEKVIISKDDAGNPMNLVRFDTGVIWGISKKPGQPFVLVQVVDGMTFKETTRFLVTIEQ